MRKRRSSNGSAFVRLVAGRYTDSRVTLRRAVKAAAAEPTFAARSSPSAHQGGLSALPLVGGALVEEMGLLLIAPLTRRRDEWWADVAPRLLYLEGKVQGL